jgi:membrane protein
MLTRYLDKLRDRIKPFDTAMTVNERVGMLGGGPRASAIALAAFLSLFPLLLVGIAVVGWFSVDNADFAEETIERMGLEGRAARAVTEAIDTAESSRQAATVVGLVGLVWSGLGVVGAMEGALNTVWQVSGRGLLAKLRQFVWLVGAALLFIGSAGLGALLGVLPGPGIVSSLLGGLVLDTALFLWTFQQLTNAAVPWRAHLPGAIVGGIGMGILKLIAGVYVPQMVASSSALYGSIGVVFAILAWLVLVSRLFVYAATYNVVRYEQGHGTVTVDLEVPHIEGVVPLEATRGGAVAEAAAPPASS